MNSLTRIFAILHKELLQLGRDKLTFGMIVGIPLIQLMMFGYAINTDVRIYFLYLLYINNINIVNIYTSYHILQTCIRRDFTYAFSSLC